MFTALLTAHFLKSKSGFIYKFILGDIIGDILDDDGTPCQHLQRWP
jgi:hypothetical protein